MPNVSEVDRDLDEYIQRKDNLEKELEANKDSRTSERDNDFIIRLMQLHERSSEFSKLHKEIFKQHARTGTTRSTSESQQQATISLPVDLSNLVRQNQLDHPTEGIQHQLELKFYSIYHLDYDEAMSRLFMWFLTGLKSQTKNYREGSDALSQNKSCASAQPEEEAYLKLRNLEIYEKIIENLKNHDISLEKMKDRRPGSGGEGPASQSFSLPING